MRGLKSTNFTTTKKGLFKEKKSRVLWIKKVQKHVVLAKTSKCSKGFPHVALGCCPSISTCFLQFNNNIASLGGPFHS